MPEKSIAESLNVPANGSNSTIGEALSHDGGIDLQNLRSMYCRNHHRGITSKESKDTT